MNYRVEVPYVAYGWDVTYVEANSPEEAIIIAHDLGVSEFSEPHDPEECEWDWNGVEVEEAE